MSWLDAIRERTRNLVASVILILVSTAAVLIPARRATKVDPIIALRAS